MGFIIFIILVVLGIWFFLKKKPGKESVSPQSQTITLLREKFPYKKKDYLLSVTECKFYYALKQVAEQNNWHVFAKVRLEDLLWLPSNTVNRFSLRNRGKSRHIDFVICDYRDVRPLLAIELDDASHNRPDRQERDEFIDQVFNDAGLPILHYSVKSFYNQSEISAEIGKVL